jgi:hypothetical protein
MSISGELGLFLFFRISSCRTSFRYASASRSLSLFFTRFFSHMRKMFLSSVSCNCASCTSLLLAVSRSCRYCLGRERMVCSFSNVTIHHHHWQPISVKLVFRSVTWYTSSTTDGPRRLRYVMNYNVSRKSNVVFLHLSYCFMHIYTSYYPRLLFHQFA